MKFDGKDYFNICKILDKKLTKEESDLIKNVIEGLSKDKEDLKTKSLKLIGNVKDLQKLTDRI